MFIDDHSIKFMINASFIDITVMMLMMSANRNKFSIRILSHCVILAIIFIVVSYLQFILVYRKSIMLMWIPIIFGRIGMFGHGMSPYFISVL